MGTQLKTLNLQVSFTDYLKDSNLIKIPNIHSLHSDVLNYKAGNISSAYDVWIQITSDHWVLETVRSGLKLDFTDTPVCKNMAPSCSFNENEKELIDTELQKLLKKQVIQKLITLQKDAFVSSVFTRPKTGWYS